MVLKTARRRERRNFIENSQGPGASAGVQDAPRSVPSGSEEDFPCINFAIHLVETPKSVAVKTCLKMDLKNDEKWLQDGVKMGSKIGSKSASETRSILGPSWDPFFDQNM